MKMDPLGPGEHFFIFIGNDKFVLVYDLCFFVILFVKI